MAKRDEYIGYAKKMLNNPKKMELLYRGSENNFSAAVFHTKCNNINDTFTLVRTEFGKIIGGYSNYRWNQVNNTYVVDGGKRSFLLSFDLKDKMVPINGNNLIFCNGNYGPAFGGGHDLMICDRCHENNGSYANFPYSYNTEKM